MVLEKDRVVTVRRIGNDDIASLIHKASIAFHALPEDQQAKLMEEQRNSWVTGEAAIQRRERLQTIVDNHALQTHANTQEEVEYALTKLQGKLLRLNQIIDKDVPLLTRETLGEAITWANTLRTAIEKQKSHG